MRLTRLTYGLLTAGLALACVPGPAQGQTFLGKPVEQWLAGLDAKTTQERRNAAFALGKMGKDAQHAVKYLTARLDDPDRAVREAAAFAIGEICLAAKVWRPESLGPLCARLKDEKEDPLVRRSAAFALGSMGRANDPEVRAALGVGLACKDPAVRQNVAWALGHMGDKSAPEIRQALQDADTLVRRDAAKALGQLSPAAAAPAVPDLVKCCQDKDVELRKAAVTSMVRLANPQVRAVALGPVLALLKDPDPEIRQNAALAAGHLGGPEALAALDPLLEALRKGDINIKRQAALALKNLGPPAAAAVPDLRQALHSPDKVLKLNAAAALTEFKQAGEPAVPDLLQLVQDRKEDKEVRKQAAVALSRIGYNDALAKALDSLLNIVADPSEVGIVRERTLWPVRLFLKHAVEKGLEKEPEKVVPYLTRIVGEPPRQEIKMLRYDSAYLLGMFKQAEAPEKAIDVLGEFLKDPTIKVFVGTEGSGEGSKEGSKSGKTKVTDVGKGDGRVMAVDALSQIGGQRLAKRPDIVNQLRALQNDPSIAPNLREKLKTVMPQLEQELKSK